MNNIEKNNLVIWTKWKEIQALKQAARVRKLHPDELEEWQYWSGKAEAFSNVWQRLLWGDADVHPQKYNAANDTWSQKAVEKYGEHGD